MSALTLMTAKAANDWAIATNFMIDELKVYLLMIMMYVVVRVLVYVRLQIGQDRNRDVGVFMSLQNSLCHQGVKVLIPLYIHHVVSRALEDSLYVEVKYTGKFVFFPYLGLLLYCCARYSVTILVVSNLHMSICS